MTLPPRFPLRDWILGSLLLLLAHAAPAAERPVWTHALTPGATAEVRDDATLVILDGDVTLLEVSTGLRLNRGLRHPDDRVFAARRREGDEGGRRGFSAHADDDGDGLIDEDPLDGRDDDDDGLVDEDYAAIGDDMTAVSFQRGGRALHLETYHWNYPHLRGTVFTSWRRSDASGESRSDRLLLELPEGDWAEMKVGWDDPAGAADRMMMVACLSRGDGRLWIGVTLPGEAFEGVRPRIEGGRLELPLDGDLVCAISVTPTLSQLRERQAVAHAVRAGAPAGPDLPAVPWIVPPLQHGRHVAEPLAATWDLEDAGWRLDLEVPDDTRAQPDPETLSQDGRLLGVPVRVSWRPTSATGDDARAWSAPWPNPDPGELWRGDAAPHPYRRGRVAGGMLTFHFAGAAPLGDETRLVCESLCGQGLLIETAAAAGAITESPAPAGRLDPEAAEVRAEADLDRRPPTLSPELLDTYPNPFRQLTQLRYTVPATVGEAFVWEPNNPTLLKDQDPVPYSTGTPSVSLRVYTVAGHEVATIFDGICATGTYQASWDGTDREGRPVAVGTYFCKLQIENWSVTKRVALLR